MVGKCESCFTVVKRLASTAEDIARDAIESDEAHDLVQEGLEPVRQSDAKSH